MEFDNQILEIMMRVPRARQIAMDMEREEKAQLAHLRILGPFDSARYDATDSGNACLFADLWADRVRFASDRGCWYAYENGVWNKDHGAAKTMELCRGMARMLHLLSYAIPDETLQQEAQRRVMRLYALNVREKIVRDAATIYPMMAADLDTDPWLLNVKNGVINLQTGEFMAHRPSLMMSRQANVTYDPAAQCPRWDEFIRQIMSAPGETQLEMGDNRPDAAQEKAAFLQRAAGYALTGSTTHECLFILHGQSTRNGKGTLMETITRMMGGYACSARPETLAAARTSGASHNEDVARLAGARLVSVAEPDRSLTLSAGLIKQMTGNDTITARALHENSFEYKPQFKLFINTNHLPRVNDMTLFSSGRIRVLPFERHFSEEEQDQTLKTFFAREENLSAVLNWCLQGAKMWLADGLPQPKDVKTAADRYRRDNDVLALFLNDCLRPAEGVRVATSKVYQRYRAWCAENGEHPENSRSFWQMARQKVEVKRGRVPGCANTTSMISNYEIVETAQANSLP